MIMFYHSRGSCCKSDIGWFSWARHLLPRIARNAFSIFILQYFCCLNNSWSGSNASSKGLKKYIFMISHLLHLLPRWAELEKFPGVSSYRRSVLWWFTQNSKKKKWKKSNGRSDSKIKPISNIMKKTFPSHIVEITVSLSISIEDIMRGSMNLRRDGYWGRRLLSFWLKIENSEVTSPGYRHGRHCRCRRVHRCSIPWSSLSWPSRPQLCQPWHSFLGYDSWWPWTGPQ